MTTRDSVGALVGSWCCVMAIAAAGPSRVGQAPPSEADAVVERLYAYLDAYEPKLSALVADEDFRQRTTTVVGGRSVVTLERRRLQSDMGFLRLPGRLGWLAQRSVRAIDGSPLPDAAERLEATYATAGTALLTRARAIAEGNAHHNLGHTRSINVPTLPLELLGRQHRQDFTVEFDGRERVSGRVTVRLAFRERAPGAIVAYDETRAARAEVSAWVAADDGALWRADVALDPPNGGGHHTIRVDFALDGRLRMLVPTRLQEQVDTRPSGEGTATYRNYRRFQTAGRIVPR